VVLLPLNDERGLTGVTDAGQNWRRASGNLIWWDNRHIFVPYWNP